MQRRIDPLLTFAGISQQAGIGQNSIGLWRRGVTPTLANFDAVAQVLGYRLAVEPLPEDRP